MPQRLQRLRNGSRMVAEVINNLNAACFSAHLLSSGDAGKALQSRANFSIWHSVETRRGRSHGCIAHVELTDQRYLERLVAEFESRTLR